MKRLLPVVLFFVVCTISSTIFAQETESQTPSLTSIISDIADADGKKDNIVAQADTNPTPSTENSEEDNKEDVLVVKPKDDEKSSLDMDSIVEGIITDLTAEPVDNRKYKELIAKYNDLTSQFEELKKTSSDDSKVVERQVKELESQLNAEKGRYAELLIEQQRKLEKAEEKVEKRIADEMRHVDGLVDSYKESFRFGLLGLFGFFAAIGVALFFWMRSHAEKAIQLGIESQAGIEVQRYLTSIKLEERLEQKGHHAINQLFAEIGDKSRDTIKKLEGIQSEYEGTLVTLKDRFEQTSDDALRDQFDVIELKSQDKIQNLNDIQAEYETTLHKLKEKVTEITGHLSIKGETDLQAVVEELEHKSSAGISRLDNIQDEYESTLESLKGKIKDVEDQIVEQGAEAIKDLFADLDRKSDEIVVRLNEIQSEYEETLKRLEADVNTAEEQLLEKGDVVLKSFLKELEQSSEQHFDELKKQSDEKISELEHAQETFDASFQHLTEQVEHVADDVAAKGSDAVSQILSESEAHFGELKSLSDAKLQELDLVQEKFDESFKLLSEKVVSAAEDVETKGSDAVNQIIVDSERQLEELKKRSDEKMTELDQIHGGFDESFQLLSEKVVSVAEGVEAKGSDAVNKIIADSERQLEELKKRSDEKISELDQIHGGFDESFQLLSEKVEQVADEVSIKGNEAVLQLLTELEKSTERVKELDTIRDSYQQNLDELRQRMDECEDGVQSKADLSVKELLSSLEEKSEGKIVELGQIKQEYSDDLAELKKRFHDAEEQITAVDVPAMESAYQELVEQSEGQIAKLAQVKNEYQVTLDSLTERAQQVEKAIAESTEVAIENLFNEIEARSDNKIGELDELQSEFESTLTNLKDRVKETEVKIVETNEVHLEELSQKLENKSNDEIRKLNELQHEYLNTLNYLNEKIEECEHERLKHEALPAELEFEVYNLMEKAKKDFRHGEFKNVVDTLCRVIALSPREEESYMLRAQAYVELDLESKALDDLSKVIKLTPDNQEALRLRASTAKKLHENGEAIEALTSLIELNPEDSSLYCERGVLHGRLNEDSEAISDFSRAIELMPGKADPYYFRSLVYKKSGEADKAIADLTEALGISKSAGYYKNRAILLSRTGRYDQAIEDFQAAIEIDGGADFSNRVNLAKNLVLTERAAESCDMLTTAIEDAPKVQDKIMCLFYLCLSSMLSDGDYESYFDQFSSVVDAAGVTMNCYLTDLEKWLTAQELEQTQRSFIDRCIASLKSLRK